MALPGGAGAAADGGREARRAEARAARLRADLPAGAAAAGAIGGSGVAAAAAGGGGSGAAGSADRWCYVQAPFVLTWRPLTHFGEVRHHIRGSLLSISSP